MEELKELIAQLEFKAYHQRRMGHYMDLENTEYELIEAQKQLQELINNQVNK
jgi:hypothetical protein